MSEKDQFYIGVKSPVEIRRQVLESSRSVLQTLQQYEKFKELRMQKLEEIAALKNILRELDNAVGQLRNVMPKAGLREMPEESIHHPNHHQKKKTQQVSKGPSKHDEEVAKLEQSLQDIEERLSK